MKRFKSFSIVSAATILLAMISWGGLLQAQDDNSPTTTPPQTQAPSSQTQQPDTGAPPATTPQAGQTAPQQTAPSQAQPPDTTPQSDANGKEFVGTIVKQGDKYVFQDAATGTTHDIDHQDEVKKFEGKKVRVRGTLDSSGTIHVQ